MSKDQSNIQRFWAKVTIADGPNPCWEWCAARNKWGYGRFYPQGGYSSQYAHRYSYELFHGPIPPDLQVLHRCDNPCCVNPNHLFLGTQRDNVKDMIAKGHMVDNNGERSASAKLTAEQVRQIRQIHAQGEINQTELAHRYQVSSRTIGYIVNRQKWRSV
jgi:hypothetical protein